MTQRVIKFRAWMPSKHIMTYMDPASGVGMLKDIYTEDDWLVMQFTGLHDKKNQELWESDIVRAHEVKDQKGYVIRAGEIWVVHYSLNAFSYFRSTDVELKEPHYIGQGYVEKIGNEFENPELIQL